MTDRERELLIAAVRILDALDSCDPEDAVSQAIEASAADELADAIGDYKSEAHTAREFIVERIRG